MAQGRKKGTELSMLTKKQEAFAFEYATNGGNARQAYLDSHDSHSTNAASIAGCKLVDRPDIQKRIFEIRERLHTQIQIDPNQYITTQLLAITETSVFDFIDESGQLKDIETLPEAKKRAIKKLTKNEHYSKEGEIVRITYNIELMDRDKAIDKLSKASGYYAAHQQSRYKSNHEVDKQIRRSFAGDGEKSVNIQNNYYQLPTEELEKKLKELKDTQE